MNLYCHAPHVPDVARPLLDLAYNYWWVKEPEAEALFAGLGGELWTAVRHNPVRLLRLLGVQRIARALADPLYCDALERVHARFTAEVGIAATPIVRGASAFPFEKRPLAAYFSAEFGLHESLPIYSGGLGVLAGDHVKSASDLGLALCGVGLLYRQGYFRQRFNLEGWQFELFEDMGFHDMPLRLVLDESGDELKVTLHLPGRDAKARIWLAQVGRCSLFLLDTYLIENWREDRLITNRLYDSSRDIRLLQEIVLGVGGARALDAMKIEPRRFHMNEGHSAFLVLERAARLIREENCGFEDARRRVRESTVFTTHTPVAAGHEVFRRDLMEPIFAPQIPKLGIDVETFFRLGERPGKSPDGNFEMTSLAIRFADRINGVSKLHGEVSRKQWNCMWPERAEKDVPIGHVTNGIHLASWLGLDMRFLLERRLSPDVIRRAEDRDLMERVRSIPDAEIWDVRNRQRRSLVEAARLLVDRQLRRRNVEHRTLVDMTSRLTPDALTIGFARRFATYKRATLLFTHRDRLARLFEDSARPIQILLSGKAHPADEAGKQYLQDVIRLSREEPFRGRVILIEDYDMAIARRLVQGADVWLNTPRPPKEASGTSGMKACPNGALTLSTRDGWWVEGESPLNGWTIGDGRWEGIDEAALDETEAASLITLLEREVVPLFYDRDESGLPVRWLQRAKESIATVTPYFNTSRMVREYAENYYR